MTHYIKICAECHDPLPAAAPFGFCSDECQAATQVREALDPLARLSAFVKTLRQSDNFKKFVILPDDDNETP